MLACDEHPRIHLVCDYNPRIGLIVFQKHIVPGLVLLYHRVLDIECILLRRHDDIFHICDIAHQQIGTQHIVGAVEVRRHAPLKVFGFADVYDVSLGVEIHVNAGSIGENGYFLFKFGRFLVSAHKLSLLTALTGNMLRLFTEQPQPKRPQLSMRLSPRCSYAIVVTSRPRGVRLIKPSLIR